MGFFSKRRKSQKTDFDPTLDRPCFFHEIRNYSATLRANIYLLQQLLPEDAENPTLERMQRVVGNIDRLISDAMAASNPRRVGEKKEICLGAAVMGCVENQFPDAKHLFQLNIAGDVPFIQGEPCKLEQVFLNLFKNAVEAGASRIHVAMTRSTQGVRVSVRDNGKGCDVETLAKIFDPFYTTKNDSQGTGLGLYLAKAIVESHGGTIRAACLSNEEGKRAGMEFLMEFKYSSYSTSIL